MNVGRVVGTVVSTVQHPFYAGRTQLVVRLIGPDDAFVAERYTVAVDLVGAGVGQQVLLLDEGTSARQLMDAGPNGPVRSVIVGIIDAVDVPGVT